MVSAASPKNKSKSVQEDLTRKEELIKTAVNLFSERGFSGTSIRDIAKSQGISVANMYHHFKNKEDLLDASLEYLTRMLPERLAEVWHESADPLERFKLLLKVHLKIAKSYQKETQIFMMNQDTTSKKRSAKSDQIKKRVLDIYVQHIESLKEVGYFPERTAKIQAFNVLGVINWFLRWYKPDGSLPAEKIFEETIAFILHGVVGNDGPAATGRDEA